MKFYYAVLSGSCGTMAGAFGKMSGMDVFQEYFMVRVLLFTAMLFCNAFAMMLFTKAMHQCDSSLLATVISSTSNYVVTAFLGYFIFGEVANLYWWMGMFLVIIGLVLVLSEGVGEEKKE